MGLDLTDIGRIKELNGRKVDDIEAMVNRCLAVGWKLLTTRIEQSTDPDRSHQFTVYVLGWPGHDKPLDAEYWRDEDVAEVLR